MILLVQKNPTLDSTTNFNFNQSSARAGATIANKTCDAYRMDLIRTDKITQKRTLRKLILSDIKCSFQ